MALLKNSEYIKLFPDGTFQIYKSLEDRLKHKKATSSEKVLSKYKELIISYEEQLQQLALQNKLNPAKLTELDYINFLELEEVKSVTQILEDLNEEFYNYSSDLTAKKGATHAFPIMEAYFSDVADSIPYIVEGGVLHWESTNIDDIYTIAKAKLRFGETEDC